MRAKSAVVVFSIALAIILPRPVHAEPTREFIMSATYGVLAGTLVGAATLAFTDKPGDNLRNIARGASYGLYAGILLGMFVVYGVPTEGEEAPEGLPPEPIYDGTLPEEERLPEETRNGPAKPKVVTVAMARSIRADRASEGSVVKDVPERGFRAPRVSPILGERGMEGARLHIRYDF